MAAILVDIDGVLHVSGAPIPGAAEGIECLRADGHVLRFVTNNTTRARARLAEELRAIGVPIGEDEIETTPLAAGKLLAGERVLALVMAAIRSDLELNATLVDSDADVVLLGGADETEETQRVFSYSNLSRAFAELENGARLVCLHRNRWWQTSQGTAPRCGGIRRRARVLGGR